MVLDDNGYVTWIVAAFVGICMISVTGLLIWIYLSARSIVTSRDAFPLTANIDRTRRRSSAAVWTRRVSSIEPVRNIDVKSPEIENVYESIPEEYIDNRPYFSRNISLGKS